ncbi:MAG TPA: hybrid sensor histidine kinase/response regulator, partial [Roseiflexaceae bacterium]|nr:hybrid sensor histidine kinase/response regulator [Roseiflexaceae bacterium]
MPEMDGFQVLEQIKADSALHHVPVIVISALDEMEFVVRSIKMGAADHLPKPFNPFLLRARVNASLATKRVHDQEAAYLRTVALLTNAAADMENGAFDPASIAAVAERNDALGQLARVFRHMAHEVVSRERHLKQENRFKSALIGKITHELRSPFASANLTLQVLRRYAEHNMIDQLREQLRLLERQLAEGAQLIDQAIAFASYAVRQTEPQREPTELRAVVDETTSTLRQLAATRDIHITSTVTSNLPLVHVDRQQIGEAIYHLVLNAIRFNRHGGTVRISCEFAERDVVFAVEDTGQGIAPEKLDLIWEAFGQVSDDVERGVEGLGLGLALVRSVVAAHGGMVQAQSTPGKGSRFGFRLPIQKEHTP